MAFCSNCRSRVNNISRSFPLVNAHQIRQASLLRRPKRPYTFTQLVALSDGSTYTQRTTSPSALQKSTKDTRNAPLWNPSSQKVLGLEADEAGRLRAFREKFGRGWDAERMQDEDKDAAEGQEVDNLMDLIGSYAQEAEAEGTVQGVTEEK
ncbi:MAG: hypothetical protein Q9191_005426, partial [Dirinaria sp. TL-2023a]